MVMLTTASITTAYGLFNHICQMVSEKWFFRSTQVHIPNGISINHLNPFFAGIMVVTNTYTETQTERPPHVKTSVAHSHIWSACNAG